MTKHFSTFAAALAISASLMAVSTPVSAFGISGAPEVRSVSGGPGLSGSTDLSARGGSIANGDLGSGRGGDGVVHQEPISSGDMGSGRADGEDRGTTSRPER